MRSLTIGFLIAAYLISTSPAAAQVRAPGGNAPSGFAVTRDEARAHPTGVQRLASSSRDSTTTTALAIESRPPRALYQMFGAVFGAGAAALAVIFGDSGEASHSAPFVVAVAIPAAAFVGAALGSVVYSIVY